jgi:hypothetical protein
MSYNIKLIDIYIKLLIKNINFALKLQKISYNYLKLENKSYEDKMEL